LNELCDNNAPEYLRGYISFVTPYGGDEKALWSRWAGVKVPMWDDIAPTSLFLSSLWQGKATASIPFCLFFGYQTGKSSDGVIVLQGPLKHGIHLKVLKSYGFNTDHEGILKENKENSREQFLKILDNLDKR